MGVPDRAFKLYPVKMLGKAGITSIPDKVLYTNLTLMLKACFKRPTAKQIHIKIF